MAGTVLTPGTQTQIKVLPSQGLVRTEASGWIYEYHLSPFLQVLSTGTMC